MRAGLLRHKVQVEEPGSVVATQFGDARRAEPTLHERRCHIRSLTVNETLNADRVIASEQLRFQFRFDTTLHQITPQWRIHFDNQVYECSYPLDPDGRKREIHIIGTRTQLSDVARS